MAALMTEMVMCEARQYHGTVKSDLGYTCAQTCSVGLFETGLLGSWQKCYTSSCT